MFHFFLYANDLAMDNGKEQQGSQENLSATADKLLENLTKRGICPSLLFALAGVDHQKFRDHDAASLLNYENYAASLLHFGKRLRIFKICCRLRVRLLMRGAELAEPQGSLSRKGKESRPISHYDLFPVTLNDGPPPKGRFGIDVPRLRKEFLQLQAKTHPDMHTGQNKAKAEGMSMLLNEAYKTLQNPLLRAQYLLSLRGIEVAEDETAKVDDPDLLMEVLETREAIEDAESETDLEPLKYANDSRIEDSILILDRAFASDDIEIAKTEAVRLRYWINIDESLKSWERGKPVVLVH